MLRLGQSGDRRSERPLWFSFTWQYRVSDAIGLVKALVLGGTQAGGTAGRAGKPAYKFDRASTLERQANAINQIDI